MMMHSNITIAIILVVLFVAIFAISYYGYLYWRSLIKPVLTGGDRTISSDDANGFDPGHGGVRVRDAGGHGPVRERL